jgi:chromosomal replication initiation ATPase DnaA
MKNVHFVSPYAYAGLPATEATKVRSKYFLKKIKLAKQLYAKSDGSKKPFYELKCDRLCIALYEFTGVSKEELLDYHKPTHLADIRNIVIAAAVRMRLGSLKSIATYFNRKDHSTVHAAAKKGQTLIKQDSDLKDLYSKLLYSVT